METLAWPQTQRQWPHAGLHLVLVLLNSSRPLAAYIIAQMDFNLTLHAVALDAHFGQLANEEREGDLRTDFVG
jgi:hypothetical protein